MRWIVVCDLDGSLMPASSGLRVSKEVEDRLIRLQEKGHIVILNSARIFQGVYPLAKQIQMDRFGGYVISANGCHVYDMTKNQVVLTKEIKKEEAFYLWEVANQMGLGFGYSQPDFFVCNRMNEGFSLDQKNCEVDYIITEDPQRYCHDEIVKCAVSQTEEKLVEASDSFCQEVQAHTQLAVIKSTPLLYDIIQKGVSKHKTLEEVMQRHGWTWDQVTAIGDGISDLETLRMAGFSVSLENAKKECQEAADIVVPSCLEDGCLVWLDRLLEEDHVFD